MIATLRACVRTFCVHANREALRAAQRQDDHVVSGQRFGPAAGRITFKEYAEEAWLPSGHLEVTTRAVDASYLRNHLVPFSGHMPLSRIMPSTVQDRVNQATHNGLSPRSASKYHVMGHSVFARAVHDRLVAFNSCEETELPKAMTKKARTLTPEERSSALVEIPPRFKALVMTAIETGLRWGALVALRPRHVEIPRRTITVKETSVEASRKDSPTGERMIVKPCLKGDEPRTLPVSQALLDMLAGRIAELDLARDDLIFPSRQIAGGRPPSRATFNPRYWRPAIERSDVGFALRMHDQRHAHASWLLAGGADLKTAMEPMGHSQIMTTQKYLHTLPDPDDKALKAFDDVRSQSRLTQLRSGRATLLRRRHRAERALGSPVTIESSIRRPVTLKIRAAPAGWPR